MMLRMRLVATDQQKRNLRGATLIFGVFAIGFGTWGVIRSQPTTGWPHTDGVVIESHVALVSGGPDEAVVSFRYAVGGKHFAGSRIGYLQLTTERSARKFVDEHPAGSRVIVFYDPANPGRAVLRTGGTTTGVITLLIGIALIGVSRWLRHRERATL